jgi:hypothetical protein
MAEDRHILKEKIKLKKETGMIEAQIDATRKSQAEKDTENEKVEKNIEEVEQDNIKLEEQIQELEGQIAELDGEFKEAQLTAGRLRKMIKMGNETSETEEKNIKKNAKELDGLNDTLDRLRRDSKREVDERKNLEYQLKTTQARIDEMESKFLAKLLVMRRIKKDERFFPKGKTAEEAAMEAADKLAAQRAATEAEAVKVTARKADDARDRAESKEKSEAKGAEKKATEGEASEEDLDLSM